ncbi:MAG TPA: NAD(P)H-binding protein, partial [Solirubrobacterales bacterium]|nr:NAD(P)H-binding protein [Solirubrobacterales bacterium]
AGHEVAGTTRREEKAEMLRGLGAEPVVIDVYDAGRLREAVVAFTPDVVIHQLTDLPSDPAQISAKGADNARIRTEGTCNLVAAAQAAAAPHFVAQSIAWRLPGTAHDPVDEHERMVLHAGGVVARYGRFYGPGTYHEEDRPEPPCIHVAEAARRALPLLDAPSGIVTVTET